jgi:hypothetical protein
MPAQTYRVVTDASTNEDLISAVPVFIDGWWVSNTALFLRFVKFWNQATGPNTAVSQQLTLGIPSEGASNVSLDSPLEFDTGLGIAVSKQQGSQVALTEDEDLVINVYYHEA